MSSRRRLPSTMRYHRTWKLRSCGPSGNLFVKSRDLIYRCLVFCDARHLPSSRYYTSVIKFSEFDGISRSSPTGCIQRAEWCLHTFVRVASNFCSASARKRKSSLTYLSRIRHECLFRDARSYPTRVSGHVRGIIQPVCRFSRVFKPVTITFLGMCAEKVI